MLEVTLEVEARGWCFDSVERNQKTCGMDDGGQKEMGWLFGC